LKPAPFDYFAPSAIEEAIGLLAQYRDDARPLAGGQSLVPMLAFRIARPSVLVDLNRIAELTGIDAQDKVLCIGAMTRQAEVLASPVVAERAPLLIYALSNVGHPPTRVRGTIGGSLSHADPAAELPVAMVALDAEFVLRGKEGKRAVKADAFFLGSFDTAITSGELLEEIRIPLPSTASCAFQEVSLRKGDFAIASAAVLLHVSKDGRCEGVRIVLGGVGATPARCAEAERMLVGRNLDPLAIKEAASVLPWDQFDLDSHAASRDYRLRIAPILAARALADALARNGSSPR
jgi:carbon-monoxide dehydrogenase medium subunit